MDTTRKVIRNLLTEAYKNPKRRNLPQNAPCQPPFRVEIFWQHGDKTPEVHTAKVEAEAQDIAKQAIRRHASHAYVRDANGKLCWDSSYATYMPRAWPKG